MPINEGEPKTIENYAVSPVWSKDGKTVYFWWGKTFESISAVRSYSPGSETITTVLDEASLAQLPDQLARADFAVSPSGDKFAFWADQLWLIEIPR